MKKTWRGDRAGMRQTSPRHRAPAAPVRCCGCRKHAGYAPMDGKSERSARSVRAPDRMTGWQQACSADVCQSTGRQSTALLQPIASVLPVPRATAVSAPDGLISRAPNHHQAPDRCATADQEWPVAGANDEAPLHREGASMTAAAELPRTTPGVSHIPARPANPPSVLKCEMTCV